jgi:hypothetical protein
VGVTSREVVDAWRDHLVAVDEADARD